MQNNKQVYHAFEILIHKKIPSGKGGDGGKAKKGPGGYLLSHGKP